VAYVTSFEATYTLYAFVVQTGAVLWTYPNAVSSPAVEDGVVYVNKDGVNLDALDARTGKLLWTYTITTTGTTGAPPTVADGRVFIGAGNGFFYALNAATGAFLWSYYSDAGQFFAAPAVANGIVYTCAGDPSQTSSACYALDEGNGGLLWTYPVYGFISGSPAVTNGLVFFDAQYSGTYALDATTGTLVWNYMEDPGYASPALASGTIYTSGNKTTQALDVYTGAVVWSSPIDNAGSCQPAVANGVIYLTSSDGIFYALNAGTGALLFRYSMGADGSSCPTVTNGEIFASGFTGYPASAQIFAFRPEHGFSLKYGSQQAGAAPKRPGLKTLRPDSNLKVSKQDATPSGP
jgi:outer membrane protein assembly factor BamB